MEFFIKKNATLPLLKMQVVNDGRSDYKTFMESLEVSTIYFSMVNIENGIYKILSDTASIVPIILSNGAEPEYYIYYQFTSNNTNKVGRYKGEFLIKNDEGNLILPLREELFINIQESVLAENSVFPTPRPTHTPTNTPTLTRTPTKTPTNTQTPTNTKTPNNTPTNSRTPDNTPTNTATPTVTSTNTPTNTQTPTLTPTNTPTNTQTPSFTPTQTPTNLPITDVTVVVDTKLEGGPITFVTDDGFGNFADINWGDGSPVVPFSSGTISHTYNSVDVYIISFKVIGSNFSFTAVNEAIIEIINSGLIFNYTKLYENFLTTNSITNILQSADNTGLSNLLLDLSNQKSEGCVDSAGQVYLNNLLLKGWSVSYDLCPSPTPTITMTPTITQTRTPTQTRTQTPTPTTTPIPELRMTFASTNANPTIATLPLIAGGSYNFIVDWGDGSQNTITTWDDANKTHTYPNNEKYNIIVTGIIIGFSYQESATPQTEREHLYLITEFGPLTIGSAVKENNYTFADCTRLELITAPTGPTLVFSDSLVGMFKGCTSLKDISNTSTWNLTNVTSLESTFEGCTSFAPSSLEWNTTNIINMTKMFLNCSQFNAIINQFITSGVTNMSYMFANAVAFNKRVDVWDISNVNNFVGFMSGKTSSDYPANVLSSIYNSWSTLSVQPNLTIDFGTIKYTSGGSAGKAILTGSPNNWIIIDGGI